MRYLKTFKTLLKIGAIILLTVIVSGSTYIYFSGPELPDEVDKIITEVIANPPPEMIFGEPGYASSQGLNIWYEMISPTAPSKGVVLLIMGIANDGLAWPKKFVESFLDSGYQVIRYDHRGTGMSDWVKAWDAENPYSLTDLANDGVAILNAVNIEKAHVVGVSMGGMIAQEMAISHPGRVVSLTSIMSTCNVSDPDLPVISPGIAMELVKAYLKYGVIGGEKNIIKLQIAARIILRGDNNYPLNFTEIAEQTLYNIRNRNGYNSKASKQHMAAVTRSGSRYDKLKHITVPTLIIHGTGDPFIPIEHGKKCASIIPDAVSVWLEEMGHDIPDNLADTLSGVIIKNFDLEKKVYQWDGSE